MRPDKWHRPARDGNGHVFQPGRYRQEFWKPLVRAAQHGERSTTKPLLHRGRKP